MARRGIAPVLPYLQRALAGCDSSLGDTQLLEGFVVRRDDAAFAALLRRHGPMVLSVCRRLLTDYQDVEDAFQATFIVLVRKARTLRRPERLGNWLYGVAYRTALKARGRVCRQRQREQQLAEVVVEGEVAELVWRELRPVLDGELQRLPEKYRVPVVLCCLEGLSKREAARRLDWPEGTLSTRLHQARHLLRQRLVRRGLTLSAGALAAAFAEGVAPAAVPAVLTTSTLRMALLAATGPAAAVLPPKVAALTEGVLQAMSLGKWKAAVITVFATALLAVGVGSLAVRSPGAPPPEVEPARPAAALPPGAAAPKQWTVDANVSQLIWSKDGQLLASYAGRLEKRKDGKDDEFDHFSTIKIWDGFSGREVVSLGEVKNSGGVGVGFSPDGKTLALSSRGTIAEGDKVEFWDARKGELKLTLAMDYGRCPPKFAYSPDGNLLAVLYAGDKGRDPAVEGLQGGVRLWDLNKGEVVRSMRGHKSLALSVAFSPIGTVVLTGGDQHDQSLRAWDVRTGKVLWSSNTEGAILGLAFSSDGKTVATAQDAGRVLLLDAATGKVIRALTEAEERNSLPSFSPDGRFLVCLGQSERVGRRTTAVKLWDVTTGKLVRTWADARAGAGFAPKRNVVAILDKDGALRLWEPDNETVAPSNKSEEGGKHFARLVDELLKRKLTDEQVVEALFVATLGRFPSESEAKVAIAALTRKDAQRREGVEDLLLALTITNEHFAHLDAQNGANPRNRK